MLRNRRPGQGARPFRLLGIVALAVAGTLGSVSSSFAESGVVRIAYQPGSSYLPLLVMQHEKLVEKEAQKLGQRNLKVIWHEFSNGPTMNDALLSGGLDVAAGGLPPFLMLSERTRGRQDIRAIAALNAAPMYVNTIDPGVRTLKDITAKDRIAVPAAKVSTNAIVLSMAAEKLYGPSQRNHFDAMEVTMSNPEGNAALLSKKTEVKVHMVAPPFCFEQLKVPGVHKVASSYDILGGPSTINIVYTMGSFRKGNPIAYRAFLNALKDADAYIKAKPRDAARIYQAAEAKNQPLPDLEKQITNPEVIYSIVPDKTKRFYDFMHKTGMLKVKAASWKDYFFPEIYSLPGS